MKLILTLTALLVLAAQRAASQQPAGYGLGGLGSTTEGLPYNASANWLEPSRVTTKGGVNFKEWKDGKVVYQVVTDKNTLPKLESVSPDLTSPPVPIWGYVKNFTVKYSSLGSCGPTLTAEKTSIVVTVTDLTLRVECPAKSYSYSGNVKPTNPFKLRRVK